VRRLAGVLLVLLLTGCGVPLDDQPRALRPQDAPFRLGGDAPPAPEGDGRVALYFVREGFVVLQTRAVERSTDIDELLDLLLEGPTPEQVAAGTRSLLPDGFEVEDVEVGDNGVAVVTLKESAAQVTTPPLGYAQIVATLTAPGRARAVRFRLDGVDLPVPRGDTSLSDEPLTREDYANLLRLSSPGPAPTASASPA
jgi:spore germination protein GerM